MNKYERHHNRIHKKWTRLKSHICPCPCGGNVGLNESLSRRFNKFYCECEACYWSSKRAMTVKGAIRNWNSDYKNALKESYSLKDVCDIAGITAEDLKNAPTPELTYTGMTGWDWDDEES